MLYRHPAQLFVEYRKFKWVVTMIHKLVYDKRFYYWSIFGLKNCSFFIVWSHDLFWEFNFTQNQKKKQKKKKSVITYYKKGKEF